MEDDVFGIVGSLQDGAFRVEQVVAEGGFAVVYRAHHEGFRADVALKCLKIPGTLSESKQAEFLEKFRAEGELLFRLSASIPAVVRPLHLGTLDSPRAPFVPFIALEWLDGMNLDAYIEQRRQMGKPPLDLRRAIQLLGPAARALEQAHRFPGPDGAVSILHRDLKPENLFVARVHGRETIKVLDFGIGKVKRAATQIVGRVSMDQSGLAAFTPAYGAPEQWLPKRFGQTGTWTDVWGLALTLVELVTGKPPLEGDAHAVMGAAMDVSSRPTPRSLGVATSDTVEAILAKALAVDPRQRYHNIGEFWDHLEQELGIATTRMWGTRSESVAPGAAAPPPPKLERRHAGEDATLLELAIPDLDDQAQPPTRKPQSRPRAPASQGGAQFDEFAELQPGSSVDSIPNIGGFRIEPMSQALGDSLELGDVSREVRPRPAVAQAVALVTPGQRSLVAALSGPAKLLVLAAVITGLDWGYTALTGESFQLGPARAFWLAGPLAVFAIVKMVFRLFDH